MLEMVMKYCRNYFPKKYFRGSFEIHDGSIDLPFMKENQYFLIEGSIFNDGVHQYPADELEDEKFEGIITALAVPRAFVDLVEEIKEWNSKNDSSSQFQSESFGGYSYTKATGINGQPLSWKDVYRDRLNVYRKR